MKRSLQALVVGCLTAALGLGPAFAAGLFVAPGKIMVQSTGVSIDVAPPSTPVITAKPTSPSAASSASFSFTGEAGVTFQCRVDAEPYSSCTSPAAYASLADGAHSFSVRAVKPGGVAGPAASWTWVVDTSAPVVGVTFPAASGIYNGAGFDAGCGTASTGDVCGTAADAGTGVSTVRLTIRQGSGNYWNGTGFSSATPVNLTPAGTTSWSYPLPSASLLNAQSYTVAVTATDAVSRTATSTTTFSVDKAAPAASTIATSERPAALTNATTASFTFTNAETSATHECQLDTGGYSACTSPKSYSGLTQGSHTFSVRPVDAAGNVGAVATYTWSIDLTPPTTTITFPVEGGYYRTSTFNAGCSTTGGDFCGTPSDVGSSVSNVKVSLRRSASDMFWTGSSFTSPTEVLLAAANITWTYSFNGSNFGLDGPYVLRTVPTDAAGNSGESIRTFNIDNTAPTAVDIQTLNGPGTAGTMDAGDSIVFTFSEPILPSSILSTWTAGSSIDVRASVNYSQNKGTALNHDLTVNTSAGAVVNLGTVNLGANDFVSGNVTFGDSTLWSTMRMDATGTQVTITLGNGSPANKISTGGTATGSLVWTPSTAATDRATNPTASTPRTESGAADRDF